MTLRPLSRGYILLAALVALVVAVSAGIVLVARTPASAVRSQLAKPPVWVGTWAGAPAGAEPGTSRGLPGSTVRNIVHTSVGGTAARITLSNLYGIRALRIGRATVGTVRVTFDGSTRVTIPAGRLVVSDPVRVKIAADADLVVDVLTASGGGPVTYHPHAQQLSALVSTGGFEVETSYWRYLTAVDVLTNRADSTVVAFGDSITDGYQSSVGADRRWPDVLADRVAGRFGVVNAGIAGNRLLTDGRGGRSGLARFDSDVLGRSGTSTVLVALGINDVLHGSDAASITAGLRKLTARAHARGLRVVGATLTPFGGYARATARREAVREAVNAAIRSGKIFDTVVDFDRVVRDPYAPVRMLERYDSGDHLHPGDAGYRAMGRAVSIAGL
ncbi:SGNH/GDSL hydrolase family protein [Streptomyces sp. NPDC050738]|uniref:SGNH/GDSL hydrolase family protein n=1 Tax=Streptomyces sp. NPDC050738 TaxID=3154744 RepID=UPI00343B6334